MQSVVTLTAPPVAAVSATDLVRRYGEGENAV